MRSKYYPVGFCIFCAETTLPASKTLLTDEHIIAFSLGGNDVLPKATCEAHQRITARIEEQISSEMFHVYRHVNNLPSRTGRDNQPFYKISIENIQTGICYTLKVPVTEAPCFYIKPSFWPPKLLDDRADGPGRFGTLTAAFGNKGGGFMRTLPSSARIKNLAAGPFSESFYRMLAKVAHTFLTAELGHNNFTPTLLNLIEGDTTDWFNVIGGFDPEEDQEREPLSLREEARGGKRYWVVSISFNSLPELPRYQVMAGISLDAPPFPERSKKAQDDAHAAARDAKRAAALAMGVYGRRRQL